MRHLLVRISTWWHNLRAGRIRSHAWRIASAARVLEKLATFGDDQRGFAQKIAYLRKLDTATFEELVLSALAKRGYVEKRNHRYTGDGGIDGRVWHPQRGWGATQAKRYKGAISSAHVETFRQKLAAEELYYGFFAHTGRTPKSINRQALRNATPAVEIVSGRDLIELIAPMKPLDPATAVRSVVAEQAERLSWT